MEVTTDYSPAVYFVDVPHPSELHVDCLQKIHPQGETNLAKSL